MEALELTSLQDQESMETIYNAIKNINIKASTSPRQPLKDIQENIIKQEKCSPNIAVQAKEVKCESTKEFDDLTPYEQDRYNAKVTQARKYTKEGRINDALKCNEKALALFYTEKLARKIEKMKLFLEQHGDTESEEEEEGGNGLTHVGDGFYLNKDLYKKLYPHQKDGVFWLWGLYKKRKGGILGDDMGLGKTIQTISFLSGMFDSDKISSVLIVLPVSVMSIWEGEFERWAPDIRVYLFHGNNKREREKALARVQRRGGVLLTSYGMVVSSWEQLSYDFTWDYMILDEGHKIKNPTKTSKGVHAIQSRNRIILTGTPVQNNLKELWALFNFVHFGTLLGTLRTFKIQYETPITRAREKDATLNERTHGQKLADSLKNIITPYFLRRTKAEVDNDKVEHEDASNAKMPTFTRKNDLILWAFMTPVQQKIYEDFLVSDQVKSLLMTSKSPLVALTVLKKICDHPRLLPTRACIELGLEKNHGIYDESAQHECAANRLDHVSDDVLMKEAGKLSVLIDLLENLKVEGHRCLVFSQSRKLLDIIQRIVTNKGLKMLRLDGTVTKVHEREHIVNKFQKNPSITVFLLTTQVGGVGLTLTGADRVVIYDPSWNPATDAQAVDRVFRIGQDRNVVIYRFITCGTVEEKIYRRQIFKDSITRQTTGNTNDPYRYFTKGELRDLFILDDPRSSKTQQQLQDLHCHNRESDTQLDAHIAFLHTLEIYGISDHNLMFQDTPTDDVHEESSADPASSEYTQNQVERAQKMLEAESSQAEMMEAHHEMYFKHIATRPVTAKERPPQPQTKKASTYSMGEPTDENEADVVVSDVDDDACRDVTVKDTKKESLVILSSDDDGNDDRINSPRTVIDRGVDDAIEHIDVDEMNAAVKTSSKRNVIASSDEDGEVIASADEKGEVIASSDKKGEVIASSDEKGEVIASSDEDGEVPSEVITQRHDFKRESSCDKHGIEDDLAVNDSINVMSDDDVNDDVKVKKKSLVDPLVSSDDHGDESSAVISCASGTNQRENVGVDEIKRVSRKHNVIASSDEDGACDDSDRGSNVKDTNKTTSRRNILASSDDSDDAADDNDENVSALVDSFTNLSMTREPIKDEDNHDTSTDNAKSRKITKNNSAITTEESDVDAFGHIKDEDLSEELPDIKDVSEDCRMSDDVQSRMSNDAEVLIDSFAEDECVVNGDQSGIDQYPVKAMTATNDPPRASFSTPTSRHKLDKMNIESPSNIFKTPIKEERIFSNVIEEELMISPDCSKPVLNTIPKNNYASPLQRRVNSGKNPLSVPESLACDTPDIDDDDAGMRKSLEPFNVINESLDLSDCDVDGEDTGDKMPSESSGHLSDRASTETYPERGIKVDADDSYSRQKKNTGDNSDVSESLSDSSKKHLSEDESEYESEESMGSFIDDEETDNDGFGDISSDADDDENEDDTPVANLSSLAKASYKRGEYVDAMKAVLGALKINADDAELQYLACKIKKKLLEMKGQ